MYRPEVYKMLTPEMKREYEARMSRQYRPEGWVNPYLEKPITGEWKLPSVLFEEGADAMLEGLKKESFVSFGSGEIEGIYMPELHLQGPGYLVFIPEELK